jgi:hypothetical protein
MQPPAKLGIARALVASVCAVLSTAWVAGEANAEDLRSGARAALSVSASVARACTVATPALVVVGDELARDGVAARVGDVVALRCSEGGETAVDVGLPSLQRANEPVVVTVLF